MLTAKESPYLAFSFMLLILIAGSLAVQTAGHVLNVPLARFSIFIALPAALLVTYGYCFQCTRPHLLVAVLLAILLMLLGVVSSHMLDLSADGIGYQQPSAWAIMQGWNPFGPDPVMLWQQLYPSGIWAIEASLAYLYGSPEDTKMLQIWMVFIALPILMSGMSRYKGPLDPLQKLLVVLAVFSTVVLAQLLTHYVDAIAYLAGLAFIGGLLMYGYTRKENVTASLIMTASLSLVVNAKLSGIYHALMLCFGAVVFLWVTKRRLPWKPTFMLFAAGLLAVLVIGYRPYVTSFVEYGTSLFPPDKIPYGPQLPPKAPPFLSSSNTESFSAAQRPSSFDDIPPFMRFAWSLFSVDGGIPHEPAQLKWPWTIHEWEWTCAGNPDPRTGGYGPFFALGFVVSLGICFYAALRKIPFDRGLITLAVTFLLFSAIFPQSWWARYVPFAYIVPVFLLLAIKGNDNVVRVGISLSAVIFIVNSAMAAGSALTLFYHNQSHFLEVAAMLRNQPEGSVYLLTPVANYKRYNDAYMPLQLRLKEQGVDARLEIRASCPRIAEMYNGYEICY